MLRNISILLLLTLFACSCQQSKQKTKQSNTAKADTVATTQQTPRQTILFFGNSITAGHGLAPEQAFSNLIQHKIDSLGWPFHCINAGLSGETTAGGLNRIGWVTQQYDIDVMVLELGGNDGLRGIDPVSTRKNLQGIIDSVQQAFPDATIILAGMEAPPNMGQDYFTEFHKVFPELARKNDLPFIPFILANVAGIEKLNQADGIHPNVKGEHIVAANVWKVLKPVLEKRMKADS